MFDIYKRKLPHWRKDEAIYFVTWNLYIRQYILKPAERAFVVQVIRHYDTERYKLIVYVVMDNHVHVILRPFNGFELSSIMHSWKSFSANKLQRDFGRKNRVWQDESHDRLIRNEHEFMRMVMYILKNPQKKWPGITEYEWMGWGKGNA